MATPDIGGKAQLLWGIATNATEATTLVGEVASVSFAINAGEIDVTPIAQSGNVFQFVIGGKKSASITMNLNYDGSDSTHDALLDACVGGVTHMFRIAHPQNTSKHVECAGLVSDFNISDDPESKHAADLTISSSGIITVT